LGKLCARRLDGVDDKDIADEGGHGVLGRGIDAQEVEEAPLEAVALGQRGRGGAHRVLQGQRGDAADVVLFEPGEHGEARREIGGDEGLQAIGQGGGQGHLVGFGALDEVDEETAVGLGAVFLQGADGVFDSAVVAREPFVHLL
jgi:hypothetical protein